MSFLAGATAISCSNSIQLIAVILQHEIQNSKTKIYIISFQMAMELGYLKGGYVNVGFAVLDLYCKITAICRGRSRNHR